MASRFTTVNNLPVWKQKYLACWIESEQITTPNICEPNKLYQAYEPAKAIIQKETTTSENVSAFITRLPTRLILWTAAYPLNRQVTSDERYHHGVATKASSIRA